MPVFLEDDLVDKYYNGFSNDILWPLFHYVPLPMFKVAGGKKFDRTLWEVRFMYHHHQHYDLSPFLFISMSRKKTNSIAALAIMLTAAGCVVLVSGV